MDDVRLQVNGRTFEGWKSARVTRGIECIAGSFEVSVSDRWAGTGSTPASWPIAEEDEVVVSLGADPVITGYVDRRTVSISATSHALTIAGRDRAGDLVDCSAVLKKWEFRNANLLTVVKQIAKGLGIEVQLQPGIALPKPLAKLTVDPGDSAFDAIERACRMAGVLPMSVGGKVVLTRAGAARATTALVEGKNVLQASYEANAAGRFSRYVVLGQHQATDEFFGAEAAAVKGEAKDLGVRRSERVLLVRPEGSVTKEYARRRAEWEAKVRASRADDVSVTVQGWRQGSGAIWPLNALVQVRCPSLGVNGEMLITQVTHAKGDDGTTTSLTLARPDAFIPEPVVAKAGAWKEIATPPGAKK